VEEVQKHFQDMVFQTLITRNIKLSEAPSYGKAVVMYDASSKGAMNYLNLARELLQKNNMAKVESKIK
jgi:chromosome partitioning protein